MLKLGFLSLLRDRAALTLVFLVPIVVFSVFSLMYLQLGGPNNIPRVKVAVLDLDGSVNSNLLKSELSNDTALEIVALTQSLDYSLHIMQSIKRGEFPVAIVINSNFMDSKNNAVEIYEDSSDSVSTLIVSSALRDILYRMIISNALAFYGVPRQHYLDQTLPIKRVDVIREIDQSKRPAIAFSAAGVGVLFLLFATVGVGGTLLEEREQGTLERLLCTRLSMFKILYWKWLFSSLIGFAQVTIMFIWGWALFELDLFTTTHLIGFILMTAFTAMAAASFGIMLATMCRSRAQLTGLSTILILIMSALGGSMFPRYLMPESIKQFGLLTFNAWALDGYQKVFWYDTGIVALWPQLLMLGILGTVFFVIAKQFARRWESE